MTAAATSPSRGRRRSGRALAALIALWLLPALIPVAQADQPRFAPAGRIAATGPLYLDATSRLLYQIHGDVQSTITISNLDSLAPQGAPLTFSDNLTALAPTALRGAGPHMQWTLATVDESRHRLFYPHRDTNSTAVMAVIDGLARSVTKTWTVPGPQAGVGSGFSVDALDYDAPSDTLYMLTATPFTAKETILANEGAVFVEAVDATSGALKWSYRVPACTSLFKDVHIAPPFGHTNGSVYVGCVAGTAQSGGIAEVVKIALPPSGAPTTFEAFASPVLPQRGLFDAANERVYLLDTATLLATFDGAHKAWVGLVDPAGRPQLGIDQPSGRLYLCRQAGGGLFSTDAGVATPVPPGDEAPNVNCPGSESWPIVSDPKTGRVFVEVIDDKTGADSWVPMRDALPAYQKPPEFDPDQGAEDIAEQDGVTQSSFSTQGAAYGSKVILVGGPLGATQNLTAAGVLTANLLRGEVGHRTQLKLAEGSREVRFGRVSKVKLSDTGVEAAAISADRDNAVDTDLSTIRQHPATSQVNTAAGNTSNDKQQPQWPYRAAECFTFGGDTDKPDGHAPSEQAQNAANASCNLKALTGGADAKSDNVAIAGLIDIGDSTAKVSSSRDPKLGIVTESTATARNVVIGPVSIAEITNTAKAWAHGRPGTANTSYGPPRFAGVKVVNPANPSAVLYACTTADTCDATKVVAAVNAALGPRIVAAIPEASPTFLRGSAKGTTASVQQNEWPQTEERLLYDKPVEDLTVPGFELRVAANVSSSSGAIIQLAGVTATAGYRVFKLPADAAITDAPFTGASVEASTFSAPPLYTGQPAPAAVPAAPAGPATVLTKIAHRIKTGVALAFGRAGSFRSVIAAWVLLLAPFYLGLRRWQFMRGTA